MDVEQVLRNTPLFSQVQKKEIKRLAAALTERSFPAGAVIMEQGKPGVGLFLIGRGTVTASVNGKPVRTCADGDHLGEVALVQRVVREEEPPDQL